MEHRSSRLGKIVTAPWRWFRKACFAIGLTVMLGALTGAGYVTYLYRSLPDFRGMKFEALRELALARTSERRETPAPNRWVPIGEISRDCLYAVVMSEDSSFFEHAGIDYDALLNSIAENIKRRRYDYGASTISQQVVKNIFLTREKSVARKFKEIWITERLERAYTKNEILELYLNLAELGRDLFGVGEAARFYFHKPPSELNAAEGAFLALLLPSPRKFQYAIFENRNLAPPHRKKLRRILGDMLAREFISSAQYHEYLAYDFFAPPGSSEASVVAPAAASAIRGQPSGRRIASPSRSRRHR